MTFARWTESGPDSPDVPMWVRWLLLALLVGLFFPGPGLGQPVPGHIDREGVDALTKLAARFPNEVAVCFYPDGWHVPPTRRATRDITLSNTCLPSAYAVAHTHNQRLLNDAEFTTLFWIWSGKTRKPGDATDLCYLSKQDVQWYREAYLDRPDPPAFFMVAVNTDVWCWWTADQLAAIEDVEDQPHWPPDGQTSWAPDG